MYMDKLIPRNSDNPIVEVSVEITIKLKTTTCSPLPKDYLIKTSKGITRSNNYQMITIK